MIKTCMNIPGLFPVCEKKYLKFLILTFLGISRRLFVPTVGCSLTACKMAKRKDSYPALFHV